MKRTTLAIGLLVTSWTSGAQIRSDKWNENRKNEVVADAAQGIIGDWKLRDAQYYPVRTQPQLINYRHVTKEYGLEHFSFRVDHSFTWTSTRDSSTYTGTWEVIPYDKEKQSRTWGGSDRRIMRDDNFRWGADLSIRFIRNGDSASMVFDALAVHRRFGTPVKFEYTLPVPNKGKDYITFFFVRDDDQADKD